MKNLPYVAVVFVCLSSCTVLTKKNDLEEKERYITNKKNSHLIDLCAAENMPPFPFRPKLYPQELRNLTDEQMDARIKRHIAELESHIDKIEFAGMETRKRVELCR